MNTLINRSLAILNINNIELIYWITAHGMVQRIQEYDQLDDDPPIWFIGYLYRLFDIAWPVRPNVVGSFLGHRHFFIDQFFVKCIQGYFHPGLCVVVSTVFTRKCVAFQTDVFRFEKYPLVDGIMGFDDPLFWSGSSNARGLFYFIGFGRHQF